MRERERERSRGKEVPSNHPDLKPLQVTELEISRQSLVRCHPQYASSQMVLADARVFHEGFMGRALKNLTLVDFKSTPKDLK